jgi:transcription initiation factor TFIID TATA-box-binding protein
MSVITMVDDLTIVNIVGTGELPADINYSKVIDDVDLPVTQYDPSIHQGLELRFVEDGPLITVYNSGKYIIRANTFDKLYETREEFLHLMAEIEIIDVAKDEGFAINNVVCKGRLQQELSLEDLTPDLSRGEAVYDPDQFPGIQYKPHSSHAVILIFRSGQIVVTGTESFESAKRAYEDLVDEIGKLIRNS